MTPYTTNVQAEDVVDVEPSADAARASAAQAPAHISWLRLCAWLVGGLAVGLAGQTAWRELRAPNPVRTDDFAWHQPAASAPRVLVPGVAAGPATTARPQTAVLRPSMPAWPSAALVPAPGGDAQSDTAALETTVLVAGEAHPAENGRLAMPAGTRFRVSVRADQSGTVRVLAINPKGQVSSHALWTGPVVAGQTVETATLRLTGTRGLETLQILLLDADGAVAGQRQVQIWHL